MPRSKASIAPIDPSLLYPLPEFLRVAGIGRTTMARGRERGVELPMRRVGRRKYVDGQDGISYIKLLSEAETENAK